MKKTEKLIMVGILAVVFIMAVYLLMYKKNQNKASIISPVVTVNSDVAADNWLTYINEEFNFSIQYPESWKLDVYNNDSVYLYVEETYQGRRYQLTIFIEDNIDSLTAESHVKSIWEITPESRYGYLPDVKVGEYTGFGVTNVFNTEGYDEYILITSMDKLVQFIYPINAGNDNYFNPIKNFSIVQEILKTFSFN